MTINEVKTVFAIILFSLFAIWGAGFMDSWQDPTKLDDATHTTQH